MRSLCLVSFFFVWSLGAADEGNTLLLLQDESHAEHAARLLYSKNIFNRKQSKVVGKGKGSAATPNTSSGNRKLYAWPNQEVIALIKSTGVPPSPQKRPTKKPTRKPSTTKRPTTRAPTKLPTATLPTVLPISSSPSVSVVPTTTQEPSGAPSASPQPSASLTPTTAPVAS